MLNHGDDDVLCGYVADRLVEPLALPSTPEGLGGLIRKTSQQTLCETDCGSDADSEDSISTGCPAASAESSSELSDAMFEPPWDSYNEFSESWAPRYSAVAQASAAAASRDLDNDMTPAMPCVRLAAEHRVKNGSCGRIFPFNA